MANRGEIDEIMEAALAAYSRVEPAPERMAAWIEAASSRRRRSWPAWPGWIAVAAAGAAALLIGVPRIAERTPAARTTVTTGGAGVALAPSPAPAIRRKLERSAVSAGIPASRRVRPSAAVPRAARAWVPFPLPRPMTAEEGYALALLQSRPTADSAPPDISQEIQIPEISIPPIASTSDSIANTNKDGNQ